MNYFHSNIKQMKDFLINKPNALAYFDKMHSFKGYQSTKLHKPYNLLVTCKPSLVEISCNRKHQELETKYAII